ncbi:hypothetical protein [Polynucleobacter sp. MG-27-Goln-C1]|uniref:hypothetical protein n=1 Tax=Polynucleobacter sp. MG-27-Goln-C1 TaxID=1819726 RepID=UPI001C0D2E72|nr:hypothetical protein [Polynucleobacter sp. MG-27-Goln-C1]MBU3612043.1 hypothetical protein [Polynucleobacter sp. MG-27-Goln-C1]
MTIKQFNATYIAPDDRLLFRFNTLENAEFRFWFTRRVTLFILAATQHLIVKNLEQVHSPQAAKAIAEFSKATMQVNPDILGVSQVSTYQPAENYPLGADPLLVMDAKCTLKKEGAEEALSLDLVLPGGANINLQMAGPTLQAMCALLNQLREYAAWGDVPRVIEAGESAEGVNEGRKPSVH